MGNYEVYQSPFSWRYGSMEMRRIWGEYNKRHLWRQLWVALAEVQEHFGLVSTEKVADLHAHMDSVNVDRALEIESEIQHDLMAELKTFAEQAKIGGAILHLGATSMDIEDNAEVLRIRQSLNLVLDKLVSLLLIFAEKIETWADLPLMAFTHLQPAEPSTLGYRLAQYAQDLLMDWQDLLQVKRNLCGKGFKGAVGTSASYAELIGVENLILFEHMLSERLGLSFFSIATQVYTRKQDYSVISGLAGLGGSLYKFAFDVRILQSPSFGEWNEPFGKKQVGSSAMPFKRNPINAEKINSLGRALAQMPRLAWDNAAHSLLERTLDDSANRRTLLPESFLICDEILSVATKLVKGLQINESAIRPNLTMYAPFAATERVLMALCKQGADRQEIHERLRIHALKAWDGVQRGKTNSLDKYISKDLEFQKYLSETALQNLMDVNNHLGDAPQRAREFAAALRREIEIRPEI